MGLIPGEANWGRFLARADVADRILDARGLTGPAFKARDDRALAKDMLLDLSDYDLWREAQKYGVDSVGLAKLKEQEPLHERRMT